MKGLIITNAFLKSEKFKEIHGFLDKAFQDKGVQFNRMTNIEAMQLVESDQVQYDFVLFWDKDIYLCQMLENIGYKVFNSSNAIRLCDDKGLTYITLKQKGIRMPKTIFAPKTFPNIGYLDYSFLDYVQSKLSFPMILKENFGSFGHQVYLVNDRQELEEQVKKIGTVPYLFQEYIKSSHGRDLRVQIVGGQVIATVMRIAEEGDFRANVTSGGKMVAFQITEEQEKIALLCASILGLDFCGVDLLFDEYEKPILCEVNSNAQFKNLYDCTKVNSANFIVEYILKSI